MGEDEADPDRLAVVHDEGDEEADHHNEQQRSDELTRRWRSRRPATTDFSRRFALSVLHRRRPPTAPPPANLGLVPSIAGRTLFQTLTEPGRCHAEPRVQVRLSRTLD